MLCVDVYPVHHKKGNNLYIWLVNPLTPVSDQDTICP